MGGRDCPGHLIPGDFTTRNGNNSLTMTATLKKTETALYYLQKSFDSLARVPLQNRRGLDFAVYGTGKNLQGTWRRMLLLCGPFRDSYKNPR